MLADFQFSFRTLALNEFLSNSQTGLTVRATRNIKCFGVTPLVCRTLYAHYSVNQLIAQFVLRLNSFDADMSSEKIFWTLGESDLVMQTYSEQRHSVILDEQIIIIIKDGYIGPHQDIERCGNSLLLMTCWNGFA